MGCLFIFLVACSGGRRIGRPRRIGENRQRGNHCTRRRRRISGRCGGRRQRCPRHCMQRTELIGIIDIVEIGSAGEMIPAKPAQIAISQDGVRGDKHLRSAACRRGTVGSCILARFRTNRQGHMVSAGFRRLCACFEPIRYRRQPTRIMRTGIGGLHTGYLAYRCPNQAERFRRILNDGFILQTLFLVDGGHKSLEYRGGISAAEG